MTNTESTQSNPERESYCRKIEEKINQWGEQMEEMKRNIRSAQRETRDKTASTINDLSEKMEDMKKKLNVLKNTGGESWKDFSTGVEKAARDLEKGFSDAIRRFKEPSA